MANLDQNPKSSEPCVAPFSGDVDGDFARLPDFRRDSIETDELAKHHETTSLAPRGGIRSFDAKALAAFLLGLSVFQAEPSTAFARVHDGPELRAFDTPERFPDELQAENARARAPIQGAGVKSAPVRLSIESQKRYENARAWFKYVESLTPGQHDPHNGLQQVTSIWSALRNEAINGNQESKKILHALSIDQIYDELTSPGRNLVRMNYAKFDELKRDVRDDKTLRYEIQWRAMEGLDTFYEARLDQNNPLCASIGRFFDPVFELVKSSEKDSEFQKWGLRFLTFAAPRFSQDQQKAFAEYCGAEFFKEGDGLEKQSLMRSLLRLYRQDNLQTLRKTFVTDLESRLATEQDAALAKYNIILLAQLRPAGTGESLLPLLKSSAPADTQRAVAWALGTEHTARNFESLKGVLADSQYDARARLLAMYSIYEFNPSRKSEVEAVLKTYSTDDVDQNLRFAARALMERSGGRFINEADHFINRFLPEHEKQAYKTMRATYIKNFNQLELTTVQKNLIDWTLLPYRDFLKDVVQRGGRLTLMNGGYITDVREHSQLIGVRNFDGRMWESIGGVSGGGHTIAPIYDLAEANATTFSHEVMHHVHMQGLNAEQQKQVLSLYGKAISEKRALNYYAAFNAHEYLAEGNKVFDALYIRHQDLYHQIFDDGYNSINGQIRNLLKTRDPELYEFLKRIRSINDGLSRIFRNDPFELRHRDEGIA